jgi:death-on-curing protein
MDYDFLDFDSLCELHAESLALYGGNAGIRDENAVHSSLAQAQWAISRGEDIAAAAAAYLYHFAVNQAFIDGNKRTAFSAAFEFLARNGYLLDADETNAYDITLRTANRQTTKTEVADWIRNHLSPTSD